VACTIVGLGLLILLSVAIQDGYVDDKVGRAGADLRQIEQAVGKLFLEDRGREIIKEIDGGGDFDSLIRPTLTSNSLLDPWGNHYLFEKREENEKLILTVRSSRKLERKWFEWTRKVLGVEITIDREKCEVIKGRFLWIPD
jgi:hypothetical protein